MNSVTNFIGPKLAWAADHAQHFGKCFVATSKSVASSSASTLRVIASRVKGIWAGLLPTVSKVSGFLRSNVGLSAVLLVPSSVLIYASIKNFRQRKTALAIVQLVVSVPLFAFTGWIVASYGIARIRTII